MNSDRELFAWKKQPETLEKWDARCREKAPSFPDARIEGDFESCFHAL